jgi:hypothetical protein
MLYHLRHGLPRNSYYHIFLAQNNIHLYFNSHIHVYIYLYLYVKSPFHIILFTIIAGLTSGEQLTVLIFPSIVISEYAD